MFEKAKTSQNKSERYAHCFRLLRYILCSISLRNFDNLVLGLLIEDIIGLNASSGL